MKTFAQTWCCWGLKNIVVRFPWTCTLKCERLHSLFFPSFSFTAEQFVITNKVFWWSVFGLYLLCWRVLGSSGRFSVVWDGGADPCLPEDILAWRGKDKWQKRNEINNQKDIPGERFVESLGRSTSSLLMSNSPLSVMTPCCQDDWREGTSGCSAVYHCAARHTAAVMMRPTSERQVTDWSAGLKTGRWSQCRGSWLCFTSHLVVLYKCHRLY